MKRTLGHPAVNAACIGLFTAVYGLIFLTASGRAGFFGALYSREGGRPAGSFWAGWSDFLAAGRHAYIAYALIAITALVIAMLLLRRRPYDEYHTAILGRCLTAALVLTLIAIGAFYLMILNDPSGVVEKFTLFIVVQWTTVVLSDLAYVLLCRWR